MNDRKKAVHVRTVVLETVKDHLWLSFAILAVVAGAVGAALVPPLVLGRIVDGLTARGGADPPPAPVVSGLHRIGGRAGIRPGERVDGIRPENHPTPCGAA